MVAAARRVCPRAIIHADASQALGKVPVHPMDLDIDFLTSKLSPLSVSLSPFVFFSVPLPPSLCLSSLAVSFVCLSVFLVWWPCLLALVSLLPNTRGILSGALVPPAVLFCLLFCCCCGVSCLLLVSPYFLSATVVSLLLRFAAAVAGHKVYAPKGIGALYIRKGLQLSPLILGGGQERGLRGVRTNPKPQTQIMAPLQGILYLFSVS